MCRCILCTCTLFIAPRQISQRETRDDGDDDRADAAATHTPHATAVFMALMALLLTLATASPSLGRPAVLPSSRACDSSSLGAAAPPPPPPPPRALLRLRGGVRQLEDRSDWEAVQAEAIAGEKLLVVDFTATWCGPCQRIAPAYAALADEYAASAILVKLDVDVLGEIAAELGVTSMPTFLFFRSGEVIDTMRGAAEAGLRALIAEHSTAAAVA